MRGLDVSVNKNEKDLDLSPTPGSPDERVREYLAVRKFSELLASRLSHEDQTVQSMPDASPAKWHLAHTTWFFETFLLKGYLRDYQVTDETSEYLFNSYYNSVGSQYPRPQRGLITRPGVDEVRAYRQKVDSEMERLIESGLSPEAIELLVLGQNHEQQHQELLLTDIKHAFSHNPICPAFEPGGSVSGWGGCDLCMIEFSGGLYETGFAGAGFCFDNELPRHEYRVYPFRLANRLVTNGEFQEFIDDGGYQEPLHWLSAGWAWVQENHVEHPLYWTEVDGQRMQFTLHGLKPVKPTVPVCHVNYYEASAFASWAGKRLPTEQEWELVSGTDNPQPREMRFEQLHPRAAIEEPGVQQLYGECWQWTSSAYSPYPGFSIPDGAVGEYNGKFMSGQQVLRGSSCATPPGHARYSYRNFFPPDARWQFSGIRLAESLN